MKTRTLFLFFILIGSAFAGSKPEIKADKVLILKKEHTLQLLRDGKPFKSYKVALGGHPEGAKTQAGDSRTPEGNYVIDSRNANSQFHLALHVSYPSAADAANAKARGLRPGGSIMIHGFKAVCLARSSASTTRLDAGLHRGYKSGNRGDLAAGSQRHAN